MRYPHRILAAVVVLAALAAIALVRPPRHAPIPQEALEPQPEANVQKAAEDLARQSIAKEKTRAEEQMKARERELRAQRAAEARGLLFFQHALAHFLDGHTDSAQRLLDNEALASVKVLQPLARLLRSHIAETQQKASAVGNLASRAEQALAEGRVAQAQDLFKALAVDPGASPEIRQQATARLAELNQRLQQAARAGYDRYEEATAALRANRPAQAVEILEALVAKPEGLDPELLRRSQELLAKTRQPGQAALILAEAQSLAAEKRFASAAKALESLAPLTSSLSPEQRQEAADLAGACRRYASEESLARAAPPGMVPVHSGPFRMGFSGRGALENERPEHTVHLHFFYIDRHEVTCREYREFLIHIRDNKNAAQYDHKDQPPGWDHTPTSNRAEDQPYVWNGVEHPPGMADMPVTLVAWWDAYAYARFRGKRLPTEAEGEKAARGEDARLWPWGNAFEPGRCNSQEAGLNRLAPVGAYPAGASPCGALDMSGNAAEWRQDWYKHNYYEESPTHNPGGPFTGQERVVRGGSFRSNETRVRTYKRSFYDPSLRFNDVGFRCAADPAE
ncbi:MAG TPA: SUMF1/EgtB/PvdO family nonheme iron enzyme [Candidatus Brocadiia bacterium]|nr:SUMF1/EgtB/PvdO family nonheme iron enzyme [Candidatus Brocadiia bacterium]